MKEIEYKPEEFDEVRTDIRRELTREIFSSFWGIEEGIRASRKLDPVVVKAIEILPEASKLIDNQSP